MGTVRTRKSHSGYFESYANWGSQLTGGFSVRVLSRLPQTGFEVALFRFTTDAKNGRFGRIGSKWNRLGVPRRSSSALIVQLSAKHERHRCILAMCPRDRQPEFDSEGCSRTFP